MSGSATLVAQGVSAGHGARVLFNDLDLVVAPGDVIGLVGPNGAGKSTLMRIFAGLIQPQAGSVSLSPRDAAIGLLEQEIERREGETVLAHLRRRTGVDDATLALEQATEALATGGSDDAYSTAWDRWLALGGADLEDRAPGLLADVGLPIDVLDREMSTLSGGQAARVGLVALLASRFDFYLLDEPTNDLDLLGLDRLEEFVADLDAPVVVVSHDREFLARTVTTVVEIDRSLQRVAVYGGSYDAYLEERSTARAHARAAYEQFSARREELRSRARMHRAWMDKGVKNARRKAKDNDKVGRGAKIEATEKQASKARQSDRMLERLEVVEEPRKEWQLQFTIAEAGRSGDVVAQLTDAVVARGEFSLGPITLDVRARDRILVTGPNGAGKTTLLGLLLGRIAPTAGQSALGSNVIIGEVDQARALLDVDEELTTAFSRAVPDWPDADVRTLLAKFGLGAAAVGRPAATLSPGERTRATLALLQARGVNLLVLDEPTNHLDLPAIEQLEQALDGFSGTVLLVTHDRRMIATVRSTRRWNVDGGTVTE